MNFLQFLSYYNLFFYQTLTVQSYSVGHTHEIHHWSKHVECLYNNYWGHTDLLVTQQQSNLCTLNLKWML